MFINYVKIFFPAAVAFFFGLLITPFATHFFYKHRMWKRHSRNETTSSEFQKIHNEQEELKTPRVGGIIIWFSVLVVTLLFYLLSVFFKFPFAEKMN